MATIWGSATGTNSDHVNVWIDWWEDAPDYANNGSYVHAAFYAQTKSDQTSTTYDNNGNSNFSVNNSRVSGIVNDSINFRSASPYNRPKNILGTWVGWVGRDGNGNASIKFNGDFSLSSSYISGGSAGGTVSLATIWTRAGAPSNPRVSAGVFENDVTLLWNAASPGVNNAVYAYHVYYRINGGAEQGVDVGNVTSYKLDTTGWGRGTRVDFHLAAITQQGDNPWTAGWSASAYKNNVPGTPTNASVAKTFYAPGETIRVTFNNNGDPDGNLANVEAARGDNESTLWTNAANASYVDVNTTGWTPGVPYQLRVRARDAFNVLSGWSNLTAVVMVGLPVFVQPKADGVFKRVVSMQVYVPGIGFKTVKNMKIAPAQGAINKTVF